MDVKLKLIGLTLLGLFIKWVVLKWALQKVVNVFDWCIRRILGKYPAELAIWLHYQKKRKGAGHQHPNPLICNDEDCQLIQAKS